MFEKSVEYFERCYVHLFIPAETHYFLQLVHLFKLRPFIGNDQCDVRPWQCIPLPFDVMKNTRLFLIFRHMH
ncbi:hypothetical protein C0J52_09517 [Blattella germanica]|nr:hypothetical protein C0J52_09517 [Blattella germanica]